jgi:hypothetical protein
MISVTLCGGLGNMMFQIAALEEMGRRSGFKTCYPLGALERISKVSHSANARDYLDIFENFNWPQGKERFGNIFVPFKYTEIDVRDNTNYVGYFQSDKYFERAATLRLFEPAEFISDKLPLKTMKGITSIHVRRGDFLTDKSYIKLTMDYYYKAMDLVRGDFMIFSDDYAWCKKYFKDAIFFEDFREPINYMELFWMSMCENNIIANSTFSWWGSYLNKNPNKKVIAPKKWFNDTYSEADIICSNWITI